MELDLREAVARRELEVFYQPLYDLTLNRVTGFEALLRWRHPIHGMVSPAQFIPIAEEVGLIVPIGAWVLMRACQDAATWPEGIKVAVNLSPLQFRSNDLVRAVRSSLDASGLLSRRLELEITESALLKDSDKVLATLHELRSLGVEIALDDFGTGYSSLSYLRNFPFSKIKIDQSFVREMTHQPDCLAIVHSIAQLAGRLRMVTTAEGVETREQLDQVRGVGCTQAQGYYFDRPKPASEIIHWFAPQPPELERAA
jgi:EAL domain-containing protein (putative c-di-GMP-specific phosphodiesterase class I)